MRFNVDEKSKTIKVDYRFQTEDLKLLREGLEKQGGLVVRGQRTTDKLFLGFIRYLLISFNDKNKQFNLKRGHPVSTRKNFLSIIDPFVYKLNHGFLFKKQEEKTIAFLGKQKELLEKASIGEIKSIFQSGN